MRTRYLAISLLGIALALVVLQGRSMAQTGGQEALDDPIALGAWLYQGNCVSCHGTYGRERVGKGLDEDELLESIEGGSGGCSVDWSIRQGGSLRVAEIKALAAYILAWEDQGQEPELPPLPPQPTPTPRSTPTRAADQRKPASTATPTPALDPVVQLAIDSNELARGAWLYTQNCHRCHLAYEQGRQGKGLTEDRVEKVIKRGKDGTSMTAFSVREGGELTATEIRSIVAYVIAWETLDAAPALPDGLFIPPTPDPADLEMIELPIVPAVSGDPLNGARLYDQHCARCHGLRGEGVIGPQLAKVWPSLRADLTIKSTIANGVPGTLMPAWSQAEGGELSEEAIDDLVVLLLQWQPSRRTRIPRQVEESGVHRGLPNLFGHFRVHSGLVP